MVIPRISTIGRQQAQKGLDTSTSTTAIPMPIQGTPTALELMNEFKQLPEAVGPKHAKPTLDNGRPNPLFDIQGVIDTRFQSYVDNLPPQQKDAVLGTFASGKTYHPELDVKAAQDGGIFGLVQDVAGEGLGILAEGLNLLDIASNYTERSIGVLSSYLSYGFGNDLTLAERWTAGQLAYESILPGIKGQGSVWKDAISLAIQDDDGFEQYIEEHRGGLVDTGFRVILDPLWLIGGMPLIAGGTKLITRGVPVIRNLPLGGLEAATEVIGRGFQPGRLPGIKQVLSAGENLTGAPRTAFKVVTSPLALLGVSPEVRAAERVIHQVSMHSSVAGDFLKQADLMSALNQASNRGPLWGMMKMRPDMAAETVANHTFDLLRVASETAENPAQLKAILKGWQQASDVRNLPAVIQSGAAGDMFGLLRKVDFDSFTSLKKPTNEWRQHFQSELIHGAGKGSSKESTRFLNKLAQELYQVENKGPLLRLLNPYKKFLAMTLLNNPGYVVLNAVNNLFTVGFDALDSFDRDPFGTLNVVSPLRIFKNRHDNYMAKEFGANWRSVRDSAADISNGWMQAEFGVIKDSKRLIDNKLINFGVTSASRVDLMARNMAAELGMLRSRHYLNTWAAAGGVFDNLPEDFSDLRGLAPTELIDNLENLRNGQAFGLVSLRRSREDYFNTIIGDIDDPQARAAARETLEVHLRGQLDELETGVLEALARGDRQGARDVIAKSQAEMQMWRDEAARRSHQFANTPSVRYKNIQDSVPLDTALLTDEFVFWHGQMNQLVDASGVFRHRWGSRDRARLMETLSFRHDLYMNARRDAMEMYTDAVVRGSPDDAKRAVDQLASTVKDYKVSIKSGIDNIVNEMAKVDIHQARVFNDSTRRYLDSIDFDTGVQSAMRSAYWPSNIMRDNREQLRINLESAFGTRSRQTRATFADNITDFRVGSFAPPPVIAEAPMLSSRFDSYGNVWQGYTDHLDSSLNSIVDDANRLVSETRMDELVEFVETQLKPRVIDYEFARGWFARVTADFSMLDYSHQMGAEKLIQMVFPYEFWPTRTAWHWVQRGLAKPGAVASLWKIKELQDEYIEDVNQKYVHQIRQQLLQNDDFDFVKGFVDSQTGTDEIIGQAIDGDMGKIDGALSAAITHMRNLVSDGAAQETIDNWQRVVDQLQKMKAVEGELAGANALAGRMRRLTVPVPFLNDMLGKVGLEQGFLEEFAFDPYAAMFPVLQWDKDYDFDKDPGNPFGRAFQALSESKLSVNPFMKSALALTGILPEGETAFDWLRNTGSPAAALFGFGGAGQAAYRWLSLGDEGPIAQIEEEIGEDIRGFFMEHGYGGPGVLRAIASEITGADPRDELSFEIYTTARSLASLAAVDPKLVALERERKARKAAGENPNEVDEDINDRKLVVAREYVKAYHDQSGPLWNQAKKTAATETGLRDLTKWMFGMGGANIWMPGEVVQTGLEWMEDAVNELGDRDAYFAFLDQYPEFTSRKIQDTVLRNKEEAHRISRERLYYWDRELVTKTYAARLDEATAEVDAIRAKIDELDNSGQLNLRVVRDQRRGLADERDRLVSERSAIFDERQKDYDRITTLYGSPKNSVFKNPMDRAMDSLLDEWYDLYEIEDGDERRAAQERFLSRFPAGNGTENVGDWLAIGAQAAAIREKAFLGGFDKENEVRNKLNDERDAQIEQLTNQSFPLINRRMVETHIGLNEQGPPSPGLTEYITAINLFQQYISIENLGLSEEDTRTRKKEFWDSNPLLEKYYGLPSYAGHPEEAIRGSLQRWFEIWQNAPEDGEARRSYIDAHEREIDMLRAQLEPAGLIDPQDPRQVRLSELWEGYFSLPEGSDERRAYFNANKPEIDSLNSALGNEPSKGQLDVSRESQIWNHYFSLPKGAARRAYLLLVHDELNQIRRRLGKELIVPSGLEKQNPRLSDSSPLDVEDILEAVDRS